MGLRYFHISEAEANINNKNQRKRKKARLYVAEKVVIGEGGFGSVYRVIQKIYSDGKTKSTNKIIKVNSEQYKNHVSKNVKNLCKVNEKENEHAVENKLNRLLDTEKKFGIKLMAPSHKGTEKARHVYRGRSFFDADANKQHEDFVVMKALGDTDLHKYILENQNKITNAMADQICLNVFLKIKELNKQGIFHRDIKPANICIDSKTLEVYIIDFGLATDDKDDKSKGGTKGYKAPEIVNGQGPSSKTDSYAAALTCAQLFNISLDKTTVKRDGNFFYTFQRHEKYQSYIDDIFAPMIRESVNDRMGIDEAITKLQAKIVDNRTKPSYLDEYQAMRQLRYQNVPNQQKRQAVQQSQSLRVQILLIIKTHSFILNGGGSGENNKFSKGAQEVLDLITRSKNETNDKALADQIRQVLQGKTVASFCWFFGARDHTTAKLYQDILAIVNKAYPKPALKHQ